MDLVYTKHASDVKAEREIKEEWVMSSIQNPDRQDRGEDGNLHFYKAIPDFENRVLHVVVNDHVTPNRIVTLFFDRRVKEV
jgi:hypothetical protein